MSSRNSCRDELYNIVERRLLLKKQTASFLSLFIPPATELCDTARRTSLSLPISHHTHESRRGSIWSSRCTAQICVADDYQCPAIQRAVLWVTIRLCGCNQPLSDQVRSLRGPEYDQRGRNIPYSKFDKEVYVTSKPAHEPDFESADKIQASMNEMQKRCTDLLDSWLKDYERKCLLTQESSSRWSDFYKGSSSHYKSSAVSADLATFRGAHGSSKTFLHNVWKLTQLDPGFKRKYGHDASSVGIIVFPSDSVGETLGCSESVKTVPGSIPASTSRGSVGGQSGGFSKRDLFTVVSYRLSGIAGQETDTDKVSTDIDKVSRLSSDFCNLMEKLLKKGGKDPVDASLLSELAEGRYYSDFVPDRAESMKLSSGSLSAGTESLPSV
jgi:hypothetical protein